jgi:hypothetical protein
VLFVRLRDRDIFWSRKLFFLFKKAVKKHQETLNFFKVTARATEEEKEL